jgi:hypothetical protein
VIDVVSSWDIVSDHVGVCVVERSGFVLVVDGEDRFIVSIGDVCNDVVHDVIRLDVDSVPACVVDNGSVVAVAVVPVHVVVTSCGDIEGVRCYNSEAGSWSFQLGVVIVGYRDNMFRVYELIEDAVLSCV